MAHVNGESRSPASRPTLLILSHILTGHLTPALHIATGLRSRGWTVFFLGPTAEQSRIERSGAIFLPLLGAADLHDGELSWTKSTTSPLSSSGDSSPDLGPTDLSSILAAMPFLTPADARTMTDTITHCLDPIPAQWTSIQSALRSIHSRLPDAPVLILCDAFFHGLLPLYLGAPLGADIPRPVSSVCLSVTPPAIRSVDLPPFGIPSPFDPSPAGRARNAVIWEQWAALSAPLMRVLEARVYEAGAVRGVDVAEWPFLSGLNYLVHPGGVIQLGVPGFEYPRADWPPGFRFAGILPPDGKQSAVEAIPAWWDEVGMAKKLKKKVVVVSQGTFQTDQTDLLIPTLHALADRPDLLVIAILGRRGAKLPPGSGSGTCTEETSNAATIPANAVIVDFLPYDAILPHADVWVHNGGFGAVTHGIAHRVPMVVAGEGQDKSENARRVAWSAIGVDMGNARPGLERLREAVEEVLREGMYQERVEELWREGEGMNCFALIEAALMEAMDG